jgi:predicted signal transduction protein with EAL and GGDEF domain
MVSTQPALSIQAPSRFVERLEAGMACARTGGHRLALLLVGLEGSRLLGSLEPEAAGDLARRARERLARCAGTCEDVENLGRDEYGLLLPRVRSGTHIRDVARRVLGQLRFPLRASIGIAVCPSDAVAADALIGCAASALVRARCEGRSYCFYLAAFEAREALTESPGRRAA